MTKNHEEREEQAVRKELADHEARITALEEGSEDSDVSTQAVSDIAQTTAVANSTLVDEEQVDRRGVVASTSSHPRPEDVDPNASGYEIVVIENGSFPGGKFPEKLANLIPNTQYFVRAWIHDEGGFAYGNEVNFKTLA